MANAAAPWENDPEVTQSAPWESDPVVEPSFTERVSADWDKRNQQAQEAKRAYDAGQITTPQLGLRAIGIGARKLNDLVGEAATSVGQGIAAITPEAIKQPISEAATSAMESGAGQAALKGAGYVADKYGQLKQEYPAVMGDIEDAASIFGAIPASFGITKGAKGAAELTGDLAVTAAKPNIAEGVKPLARRAREFGIDLRKDQVAPTRFKNTMQKVSQEVPFSGVGDFEAKQRAQWNKAVAGTLGLDAPDLSPENINQFLKNSSKKFDVLVNKKAIPFDEKRLEAINSVVAEAYDSIDPNLAQIVDRNAGKLVAAIENGTISGEKLGSIRSELVKRIPNASGDAKSYLSNLVEAIDDSIEPVLSKQEKEILATARRQWRNYKTVEPLLEGATDGQINPTQLLNRVKSSKYIKASRSEVGKDDLVDLARIGKEFMPMKAGSDTFQKAALGTGATGLAGYAYADPIGALGAAGVAGAGMAANRAYQGVNTSQKLIDAALKERKARFGLKDVIKNESSGRPNLKTKIKNLAKDESGSVGGLPDDYASRMARAKEMGFDVDNPVYHGTGKEFTEFSQGGGTGKTKGTGAFFSSSPETASTYALGDNENVVKAVIKKGNYLEIDANGRGWSNLTGDVKFNAPKTKISMNDPSEVRLRKLGVDIPEYIDVEERSGTLKDLFRSKYSFDDDAISTDDIARWAKSQGYEGVVFKNVKDRGASGKYASESAAVPQNTLVVFDPKNIRSVNAKFDPSKANSADLMALRAPIAVSGGLGAAAYALSPQDAKAEKPSLKTKIKKKD